MICCAALAGLYQQPALPLVEIYAQQIRQNAHIALDTYSFCIIYIQNPEGQEDNMPRMIIVPLVLLACSLSFATVWHVNLDTTAEADFTQISSAISDPEVVDGDTLYIYGNPANYASIIINKSLTLIGPGYHLGSNPGLQASTMSAKPDNVNIIAQNVCLMGLMVNNSLDVNAANAVIIGCSLCDTRINAGNAVFAGCYFRIKEGYNSDTVRLANATNTSFSNCIFEANNGFHSLKVPSTSSATLCYSVIRGTVNIENTECYNNIIYTDPAWGQGWSCSTSEHHNVFVDRPDLDWGTIVSGTDNLLNYDGLLFGQNDSPDGRYELLNDPANLALTAGVWDDECGIFGGTNPYKLSGIPPIPSIYELIVPAVGNTLQIRIKARTNN